MPGFMLMSVSLGMRLLLLVGAMRMAFVTSLTARQQRRRKQ